MFVRFALLCLLPLALVSCIPVEDFGSYWSKTGRDPALEGKWVRRYQPNDLAGPKADGQIAEFRKKGDGYELVNISDPADRGMLCKTLKIGGYDFIANGPKKGALLRYRVDRDVLNWYDAPGSQLDFVRAKYPALVPLLQNRGEGNYLSVQLLDDEIARVIADIPDTDDYWHDRIEFHKAR